MANGSHAALTDDGLRVRVDALSSDVIAFRGELRDVRSAMATTADIAGLKSALESIATRQQEQQKPQWNALGVMLAAMVALGGLAFWPIREATTNLSTAVAQSVNVRQYDADQKRIGDELAGIVKDSERFVLRDRYQNDLDEQRRFADATRLRQQSNEQNYMQRRDFEVEHSDLKAFILAQIEQLQRQISINTGKLGDLYSARDTIVDLHKRLDQLEQRLQGMK